MKKLRKKYKPDQTKLRQNLNFPLSGVEKGSNRRIKERN